MIRKESVFPGSVRAQKLMVYSRPGITGRAKYPREQNEELDRIFNELGTRMRNRIVDGVGISVCGGIAPDAKIR